MQIPIYHVDAFTNKIFAGKPCCGLRIAKMVA